MNSDGTVTIDGIAVNGPAFTAAAKVCSPLGHSGGNGNPAVPEQTRRSMLAFAHCMRAHGLPYNDPQFPPSGGIFGGGATSTDEATTPRYLSATKACGGSS